MQQQDTSVYSFSNYEPDGSCNEDSLCRRISINFSNNNRATLSSAHEELSTYIQGDWDIEYMLTSASTGYLTKISDGDALNNITMDDSSIHYNGNNPEAFEYAAQATCFEVIANGNETDL